MLSDDPKFRIGYKIFSVSDKRFEGAARWHDHSYLAADDWFARRRAYVYYRIVRLFGGPLWEGKE